MGHVEVGLKAFLNKHAVTIFIQDCFGLPCKEGVGGHGIALDAGRGDFDLLAGTFGVGIGGSCESEAVFDDFEEETLLANGGVLLLAVCDNDLVFVELEVHHGGGEGMGLLEALDAGEVFALKALDGLDAHLAILDTELVQLSVVFDALLLAVVVKADFGLVHLEEGALFTSLEKGKHQDQNEEKRINLLGQ